MTEPRLWNTETAKGILRALDHGILKDTADAREIKEWHDLYEGKPGITSDKDVDDIMEVIKYYRAGNDFRCKGHTIQFRVYEIMTGKDVTDDGNWFINKDGDLVYETNDIDCPMQDATDRYYYEITGGNR